MIYPPELQHRIANYRHLTEQEQRSLAEDRHRHLCMQMERYGRLRHDEYAELYPPAEVDMARMRNFVEASRPKNRFMAWLKVVALQAMGMLTLGRDKKPSSDALR